MALYIAAGCSTGFSFAAGWGMGAAEAAFRVGYESPSQFSREYRRLFGNSPRRDVAALQTEAQPAG